MRCKPSCRLEIATGDESCHAVKKGNHGIFPQKLVSSFFFSWLNKVWPKTSVNFTPRALTCSIFSKHKFCSSFGRFLFYVILSRLTICLLAIHLLCSRIQIAFPCSVRKRFTKASRFAGLRNYSLLANRRTRKKNICQCAWWNIQNAIIKAFP